jgi:hypothetical protein
LILKKLIDNDASLDVHVEFSTSLERFSGGGSSANNVRDDAQSFTDENQRRGGTRSTIFCEDIGYFFTRCCIRWTCNERGISSPGTSGFENVDAGSIAF